MHFIQGADRHQVQFLSIDDQVSADNPVRLIDLFVDKVDLAKIGVASATMKAEGRPAFHPSLLLKLYLYGYLNRVRSSRRLETECTRNIELQWLTCGLVPNYHTIANFRRDNAKPLKALFKLFVLFLRDQHLIGGEVLAIDGSKFRAQNSKKNNYNQAKINRHLTYIEEKAFSYLQELDQIDQQEQTDAVRIEKQNIQASLKKLTERKEKYHLLEEQLRQSGEDQVSTTDAESRALLLHRNIVEVAYNLQTAVDAQHNLIVHAEATNQSDRNALHNVAAQAKQMIGKDPITVLADKGYHHGRELHQCQEDGVTTIVAFKAHVDGQQNGPHPAYYVEHFTYNKEQDHYTCPEGNVLTTTGSLHNKSRENSPYQFKKYRTAACKTCPLKQRCTGRKSGREIERSQYQDAVDNNNERVVNQKQLYQRRQAIVEHPFGTIKRSWGYSYTLLKGLEKVDAEMNLIALVYNLRRSINILGATQLLQALGKWKPDYDTALRLQKTAILTLVPPANKGFNFCHQLTPLLKRTA